jgi:hypothetical protein
VQVFSGWFFVVGNVDIHNLLIVRIIEDLCENNCIPSHILNFVYSQFSFISLVELFIGSCTSVPFVTTIFADLTQIVFVQIEAGI